MNEIPRRSAPTKANSLPSVEAVSFEAFGSAGFSRESPDEEGGVVVQRGGLMCGR